MFRPINNEFGKIDAMNTVNNNIEPLLSAS